ALDLGGSGKSGGLPLKRVQRGIRQAHGELIDPRQNDIELRERRESEAGQPGAGDDSWRNLQLLDHPGVVDGEVPRALLPSGGEPQEALGGGGSKSRPAFLLALVYAITILPCGLFALGADDEGLGRDDHEMKLICSITRTCWFLRKPRGGPLHDSLDAFVG